MSQGWQSFLAPVGVWIHQRLTNSSEKSIEQYYDELNKTTLSVDLINALESLMGNQEHLRATFKNDAVTDEDGVLYWEEDTFIKWVTSNNQPLSLVMSAFMPRLWHVFTYFAGFPFTERIVCDSDVSKRISEDGFVQAYILLALRGVEILGNTKDGWTPKGTVEKSWPQKSPRLATLLFDGLKVSSNTNNDEQSLGLINNREPTAHSEEQLMDAIALTQPVPYMTGLPFEGDIRGVARRLLIDNVAPKYDKPVSYAVPRNDLQTLIELCLLLRLGDSPWKQGLLLHQEMTRMCGDIESLASVVNEEESLLAARLSHALIESKLGSADAISRQCLNSICTAYPDIVLRIYQLWTAICVPDTSTLTSHNLGSGPLNCVAQFLSLLGPAEVDSPLPVGWNEDERQLRLDFQNATLVADFPSSTAIDEPSLVERLSNDQWFHVLLISAKPAPEFHTAGTENTEQLIALFTSPSDNQISFWNCPGCPSYVWRYGFVQLLPHILTSQAGGLGASFQDGAIKLSPHREPDDQSNAVVVDLKNSNVVVQRVDASVLRLELKSLKCYRMPGTATKIHKSSNQ